jgi:lipopolysaccharide heptosyltransferase II
MPGRDWQSARRVLCVRLDALGDLLMTTPALRALKGGHEARRLTLLTSPAGSLAAPLIPELADVISFDAPWLKASGPREDSTPDLQMLERIRQERFDAAVIFTVYSQNPLPSALFLFLADIPLRLAYCRENPYQLLTDWLPDPEPALGIRHEVRRQLDLVAAAGCKTADERLSLRVPQHARERVDQLLTELGLDPERPWAVLHPGASAASRRYPPELFAAAAGILVREHGFQLLFTGTAAETELVEDIRGAMAAPSLSLAGRLSLAGLAALLQRAPLLIGNNSGPAHLAAATGTPVVDLYALTNPQHTPWGVASRVLFHDVPCRFCLKSVCPAGHHNCLRLVAPERLVAAVLDLLAEVNAAPAGFRWPEAALAGAA